MGYWKTHDKRGKGAEEGEFAAEETEGEVHSETEEVRRTPKQETFVCMISDCVIRVR